MRLLFFDVTLTKWKGFVKGAFLVEKGTMQKYTSLAHVIWFFATVKWGR